VETSLIVLLRLFLAHLLNIYHLYMCHAYNKFYIILILGKLIRVLESILPRQNELR